MTAKTLTFTDQLVVLTCWCGIGHAIPSDLNSWANQDSKNAVYCPLGHTWVRRETEADRLKKELKWAEDRAIAARADADQAEASRRAWKGQATRARNLILAGSCPFCGQHLRDVERHVARMHADEAAKDPEAEPVS